jgi:hypothetical protein
MKTSNYIVLSFFTCLFGGIFVLFLAAKIDPRSNLKQEFVTDEKPLDNFSVVVAGPGANICVKSGDVSKIGLYYLKKDTCSLPAYTVRNDTLFVQSNPPKNKHWATNVICRQVTSVEGKAKSQISLEQFRGDSLLVRLNNSEFSCHLGKDSARFSLQLIASHSYVNIGKAHMNNLDLNFTNSKMDAWQNHIKTLSGKLDDNSSISLGRVDKINLEADSTSNYRLEK